MSSGAQGVSVLIDDRAGSKDLIYQAPLDTMAELCRLESGDVMIVGNGSDGPTLVGIEVKSLSDLISSMGTGRLQSTQIPAMLRDYDVCWLLYYGRYRPSTVAGTLQVLKKGKWLGYKIGNRVVPYGYVESFLLTLSALGVRVKHVETEFEAAQWIGTVARWWGKEWGNHKGLKTFDNSRSVSLLPGMDQATHLRAKVASQLPGVGYERAIAAARHFKSVRAMVNADAAEWQQVPGVGKVIAKAVKEAVT